MLKTVLIYGLALAAGAVLLQWLEYQIWARTHASSDSSPRLVGTPRFGVARPKSPFRAMEQ